MNTPPYNTTANIVHLSGWLAVDTIETIPLGKGQTLAIRATLYTQKPRECPDEAKRKVPIGYPLLITDKPANLVVAWAKTSTGCTVKAAVQGRLYRQDNQGEVVILVKHLDLLDAAKTGPLDPAAPWPTGSAGA